MSYPIGTKLRSIENHRLYGEVITPEELIKIRPNKIILTEDICVKWFSPDGVYFATTYDAEILDEMTVKEEE